MAYKLNYPSARIVNLTVPNSLLLKVNYRGTHYTSIKIHVPGTEDDRLKRGSGKTSIRDPYTTDIRDDGIVRACPHFIIVRKASRLLVSFTAVRRIKM